MVHFGSFYKIPLFILFCGFQGCQYFGVGIIYFIIYVICGGFGCPSGTLRALKAQSPHLAGIPQADN